MYNKNEGIDLFDFIYWFRDAMKTGDYKNLDKYIIDVITQNINLADFKNSAVYFPLLDNYLKNLSGQFNKQNSNPAPEVNSGLLEALSTLYFPQSVVQKQENDGNRHEAVDPAGYLSSPDYKENQPPETEISIENTDIITAEAPSSPYREIDTAGQPGNSPSSPTVRSIHIQPEVVDTHNFVIVRVNFPDGISEDKYSIAVTPAYAVIKWKSHYIEQVIRFPSGILHEQAVAAIKDNILEITIPKISGGNQRELRISSL